MVFLLYYSVLSLILGGFWFICSPPTHFSIINNAVMNIFAHKLFSLYLGFALQKQNLWIQANNVGL